MKWQPMTKEFSAEQRKYPKKSTYTVELDAVEQDYKELMQWLE